MTVVLLLSLCRFAWAATEYADPDPVILANGNILTMNAGASLLVHRARNGGGVNYENFTHAT